MAKRTSKQNPESVLENSKWCIDSWAMQLFGMPITGLPKDTLAKMFSKAFFESSDGQPFDDFEKMSAVALEFMRRGCRDLYFPDDGGGFFHPIFESRGLRLEFLDPEGHVREESCTISWPWNNQQERNGQESEAQYAAAA